MADQHNRVFFPINYNDLFSTWNHYPDAMPYAGGIELIAWQGKKIITLPKVILCLDKIEELRRITRTEQYIEIGAMVKLNQLFMLGTIQRQHQAAARQQPSQTIQRRLSGSLQQQLLGRIVPTILYKCMENIAGVQLRNVATIGGNICSKKRLYDLPAVLTALDAQYELRSANNSRWVSAARFHSEITGEESAHQGINNDQGGNLHSSYVENLHVKNVLKKQELLTRVRLPLLQWDYSIYKKFLSEDMYNYEVLVFLAKAQKTILTDLRVVYKSAAILRNKNGEDSLLGKNLPLSRKTALDFVDNWKVFLDERPDVSTFSKNALLNNIEENVFILSE